MEPRPQEEFERLYRKHHRELRRFLAGALEDRDEVDDATQDAFLNALRSLRRGTRPAQPRPWLYAIADNVRRRRFRRAQPRPVRLDDAPEPEAPAAEVDVRELTEALRSLPAAQREALVLREVGGLSYSEVATQMGVSEGSVQMLLFRGRRALRNALRPGSAVFVPLSRLLQLLSPALESPLGATVARVAGAAAVVGVAAVGVTGADATGGVRADRWRPLPIPAARTAVDNAARSPAPTHVRPQATAVVAPKRAPLAPPDDGGDPGTVSQPAAAPAASPQVPARASAPAAAPAEPQQSVTDAAQPATSLLPVTGPPAPVPQPAPPALPPSPPLPQLPQLTLPQPPQPPRIGG